jgi:hypothetical protein
MLANFTRDPPDPAFRAGARRNTNASPNSFAIMPMPLRRF